MAREHLPWNGTPPLTRRELLARCGMGFGALALSGLLSDAGPGSAVGAAEPAGGRASRALAARAPHFPGRAKRVIHFFANGGPSHVDTFDPKPALERYAGKPLPSPNLQTERKTGAAFPSPFTFRRHGQGGLEVSDLFPHVAASADELCVIRSMRAELPNHEPSLLLMNCGDAVMSRPSVGSWVTYGLGTENENLPAFVAMCPGGYPIKEAENWQSGFLPGVYQGTFVDPQHTQIDRLIEHIQNHVLAPARQRQQLDLLLELNAAHARTRAEDPRLEARIQSFELAFRMQVEAADAFDVTREPRHILEMYGEGVQARQCLIARRLLERGVRFVQLWHGAGQPWDNHNKLEEAHRKLARESDQALGALLRDLKQRGMLEDTLVLWGGEFGRTPWVELEGSGKPSTGRDHNPYGFSVWLAGGGVRGGHAHGATDEFGFKAVEDVVHVHDLHATILHLLGFDHERLTYRYAGRDFRLTDVHGRVVRELLRMTLRVLLALAGLALPAVAAAAPRPNFLFILSDDHAAHAISAYGSRLTSTPQIDRLAQGGMLFRNCFAVNSICTPSRAAILTGKYSHKNGVTEFNRFDGSQETLPKILQRAGYHTAIVGKWHLFSDPTGFDYWNVLPGQGLYHDPVMIENGVERRLTGYATDRITDIALERLRARPADQPFALFVHHKAPHRAWEPDARHAALFKDRTFPEPETFHDPHEGRSRAAREATMTIERHLTKTDVKGDPPPGLTPAQEKSWRYQRYMQDYLACVASMDDNIGRLLDALRDVGLEESTVVVYSSDQGFFLGDHGWYDKRFMYEESLRMPLLVRYPPLVKAGSEERRMVLNVDFAPTLLELAGLPAPADMQGRSFAALLRAESPSAWRTSMYYRYYHYPEHHRVQPHYGVRTERHKLMYFPRLDEWELYDLEKDPRELRNAYSDPAYAGLTADLRREMARLREELGDQDQYADGPPRSFIEPRAGPAELVFAAEEPIADGPASFDPAGRALAFGAWCKPGADDGVILALGGASHGFSLHLDGGFPRAAPATRGRAGERPRH